MKLYRLLKTLVACVSILGVTTASAQIVITEFMAANATGILDDSGTRSDWIEIYNAGTSPVTLDGFYSDR